MVFVYLIIIFVFLLKKYLDKQSELSNFQGHFLQEKTINDLKIESRTYITDY